MNKPSSLIVYSVISSFSFILIKSSSSVDFHHIVQQCGIDLSLYSIGKSQISDELATFDMRIKEAIYASHSTSMFDTQSIDYSQIGLYKFLLPHINDKWLKNFVNDILNPIKSYDDGKLIATAQAYVHCKHDVIKTAGLLFQHKNTIRYRIKIMQQLTGIENIHDFNEQLSIAIKFESLTLKNSK